MNETITEKINEVVTRTRAVISNARDLKQLDEARVAVLGKNGEYTSILKGLKDVSGEERPRLGKLINNGRELIESMLNERIKQLKAYELEQKMELEKIDVSLDRPIALGSMHPITLVKKEILDIFIGLGFEVAEGPEIETDFFNFQALGIPLDHPARDMQDTFYITDSLLLRTHTSPMQARMMLEKKPPIRVVIPGKVYRADNDATHSPIFNQIEGLAVDTTSITLADLKGCLEVFAKTLFDDNTKVRFRPSYFPFTEPSVEVDVTCSMCGGKGCRLCKGTGWMEILGAGIVNPVVFENCGLDSKKYSGFAFGFGLERIAMIKYGIPDMRLMYENDARFLRQYK